MGGFKKRRRFSLGRMRSSGLLPAGRKPPYRVPELSDLPPLPPGAPTVASTFAGCGGSSTGYRMAGFRVLWANEFWDDAAASYQMNHAGTAVCRRDVRGVTAADVLRGARTERGELDVLDGSPPCQTFSSAGRRDMSDPRTGLIFEQVRLIRGTLPRAAVIENVAGMAAGRARAVMERALREIEAAGYRTRWTKLDAQWLGVPSSRLRVIIIAVRNDVGHGDVFPKYLPWRYACAEATASLPDDPAGRAAASFAGRNYSIEPKWHALQPGAQDQDYFSLIRADPERPAPCILAKEQARTSLAGAAHWSEPRKFTVPEIKRLMSFPDGYRLSGGRASRCRQLGNSVPPLMMARIAAAVSRGAGLGAEGVIS